LWVRGNRSPTPNFVKISKGDIPLWGKYIPKITNFCDFGGCKPTNFKATAAKFDVRVQTWETLSQAKFGKIA